METRPSIEHDGVSVARFRKSFGLRLPSLPRGAEPELLTQLAVAVEEAGLDSFWLPEHLLPVASYYDFLRDDPVLEPMVGLSYVAAATRRIALGTAIALAPFRHPLLWAKTAATLQYLSNGRLILGLGTGWAEEEFAAFGVPHTERGSRTDETVDVLLRAFDGQSFSHKGRVYAFNDAVVNPVPRRRPLLWGAGGAGVADYDHVGASTMSERVVTRLARMDGWLTRPTASVAQAVAEFNVVRERAAQMGRDPGELVLAHVNFCHLVEGNSRTVRAEQEEWFARTLGSDLAFERVREMHWTGTLDEIAEQVRARLDSGVDHVIVHPLRPTLDQVALWSVVVARVMGNR